MSFEDSRESIVKWMENIFLFYYFNESIFFVCVNPWFLHVWSVVLVPNQNKHYYSDKLSFACIQTGYQPYFVSSLCLSMRYCWSGLEAKHLFILRDHLLNQHVDEGDWTKTVCCVICMQTYPLMCTFHGLVKSQKPLSGLIHHSWELTWGQKLPEEKKEWELKHYNNMPVWPEAIIWNMIT